MTDGESALELAARYRDAFFARASTPSWRW
jgi:hypothetical protein